VPRRLNTGNFKIEDVRLQQNEKVTQYVQVLGTIGPPQTLGELSVLTGNKASASVIADSEEVEVLVLETSFMNIMFVRYPDMVGRFYHYLASIMARRLSFHEADS